MLMVYVVHYAFWSKCLCSWPLNVHISSVISELADLVNTISGSKALDRSIWTIFFNGASGVMPRSNKMDPWTSVHPRRFIFSVRTLTLTWTQCFLLDLGPFSPWKQSTLNHWGWQKKQDMTRRADHSVYLVLEAKTSFIFVWRKNNLSNHQLALISPDLCKNKKSIPLQAWLTSVKDSLILWTLPTMRRISLRLLWVAVLPVMLKRL